MVSAILKNYLPLSLQVEKVLEASHPDALEIDKAKKMLKVNINLLEELLSYCVYSSTKTPVLNLVVQDHEQALVQVIQKLVDACDSGKIILIIVFEYYVPLPSFSACLTPWFSPEPY